MPSRFRAWLQAKLCRGHNKTTKTAETDTRIAPPASISTPPWPPPPYEVGLFQGTTVLPAVVLPPSSDQAILPFANIRRIDKIKILEILGDVLPRVHAALAKRGDDDKTAAEIADAIREGTIAAAVTVRKSYIETTSDKLNDNINEGCRKVANAVIAATAAAPVARMLGTAGGAANFISTAAIDACNMKGNRIPYAVAYQLVSTAMAVVAAITAQIVNDNLCLSDIPLPPMSKFLPKT